MHLQEGWTAKPTREDAVQYTRHSGLPEGSYMGGRDSEQDQCNRNKVVTNTCQTFLGHNEENNLILTTKQIEKEWGDSISFKDDDCYRIVSKNIGSLGVRAGSYKEDLIKSWMKEHMIDVTCMQEININWAKITGKYRIYERFKLKDRSKFKLSYAFNKNENRTAFQRGGVCVHSTGNFQFNSPQHGQDPTGLGQWTWSKFQGSQCLITRIISLYIPCKNQDPKQTGSVFAQHRRYYLKQGVESCPIENLKNEFLLAVEKWQDTGERIIICADINEDIGTSKFVADLELMGIFSVMEKHNHKPPATQNRGSVSIDGIFISKTLRTFACGYSDFGDGPGDHRTVFVDIPKIDLEGSEISTIQQMPRRRLISTNVKVSGKFNELFSAQVERNSVCLRMKSLHKDVKSSLEINQMLEYEKIDRIVESAFGFSNKRCRKFRMGQVAFAPEDVQKYGARISLWDLVIKKKTGCHVNYSRIRRLAKKCKISQPMQYVVSEAKEFWKKARSKYYKIRPFSGELRKAWLKKMAEKKEAEEGIEAAKYLHTLVHREDIRDSHARIKVARKKLGAGGTQKLTIPSDEDPNEIIEVTDKSELEAILMKTNYNKFSAASDTPMAQQPYLDDIGATAGTSIADDILVNDEYASTVHDPFIKLFLQHSTIPQHVRNIPPVSARITTDQHVRFWQKQNEKTQSSLSGMHFGFYKTTAKDNKLAELIASMVSIPFETGYSPHRWRQSVNVHLLKKAGEYSPAKQRTIHLIEAGLSEGCKIIFSRRMMWRAKELALIPNDQFAKKNSTASDAALLSVLLFDHMRLTRTSGISIANDLNSCYDRMVHTVASLALRRLGAPKSAVRCMSRCIQYMRHHIRTAYGDSKEYYGGKETEPLQGGGQGNPAAPPMWIAITIILLSIMNSLIPGIEISSPITMVIVTLTVIMYVDDSTIFVLGRDNESAEEVLQRAQGYMNSWCKFLWVTGGALRPEKCWYTFVQFRWVDGFWFYNDVRLDDNGISATDTRQQRRYIKQIQSGDGARIFGVRIAADGNNQCEKEYLMQCTETWAEHIRFGYVTRHDAALAIKSTISKTWAYPLPATTFSYKDTLDIMVSAYKAALPKMGSNRNLPLVYRYAPVAVQGLGLPHIYSMQGIAHIKIILSKIAKDERIGTLLLSQMEYLGLEIGNMTNIFDLQYAEWKVFATSTWITSTWEFCDKYNIQLDGPRGYSTLQRINDVLVMEKVLEVKKHFSEVELVLINQCRIYLNVMYLSDMVSGDGKMIEECFIQGCLPVDRTSQWKWPFQNKPSVHAWTQWRRALALIWKVDASNRSCNPKLGKWRPQKYLNMQWLFSFDISSQLVYRKHKHQWLNYKLVSEGRNVSVFELITTNHSPPTTAQRISVFKISNTYIYTSGFCGCILPLRRKILKEQDWWLQIIHKMSPEVSDLLDNTYIGVSKNMIRNMVSEGMLRIVCDGSFFPTEQVSTAAFVIEDMTLREYGRGYCRVIGDKPEAGPYRAELGGVHLVLHVLQVLCDVCCITEGSIEIYCDCEAAIKTLHKHPDSITVTTKQHDLLWDIDHIVRNLSITVNFSWVKGHQTELQINNNQLARMNDLVDSVAKDFARYCMKHPSEQNDLTYGYRYWNVRCGVHRMVNNIEKRLLHHIHAKELFMHLKKKYDLNEKELRSIDWQAIEKAMMNLTLSEKLWTTKHVSHFNGLGKKMAQCHNWESSTCPRCHNAQEDHRHLISCSHETCQVVMGDGLLRLSKTLSAWKTHPLIRLMILKKLQHPHKLILDLLPNETPMEIVQAAQEQDLLGIDRFIEGRIAIGWRKAQQKYYSCEYPDIKRTGLSWSAMVIRNILRYCRDHWTARNKFVQENRINQAQYKLKLNILRALEDEYARGINGVSLDERFLFDIELSQLQKLSFDAQRSWLEHVYTARNFFGERSTREREEMQRFMERWRAPRRRRRNART